MSKIQICYRNVYGKEAIYPVCRQAALFADLAGTVTLTQRAVEIIGRLGYEVEVVACPNHARQAELERLGFIIGKI